MKRNLGIDFLRTLACLLILNFHFELLFPENIKILSVGGDIGNNLFFMLSGYLLYNSIKNTDINNFFSFYKKRLSKLLPTTIAFLIVSILIGDIEFYSFKSFITWFIYPAHFWFITYLLYFYILIFFQMKLLNKKANLIICIVLLIIHLIVDNVHAERFIIGYISMIVGYYKNEETIKISNNRSLILLILSLVSYFVFKILLRRMIGFHCINHLMVGITIICICSFMINICAKNNKLEDYIINHPLINFIIRIVSPCTLEIYLISGIGDWYIIRMFNKYLPFPASYILCLILIITLSYSINKLIKTYLIKS